MTSLLLSFLLAFSLLPNDETLELMHEGETIVSLHREEFFDPVLGQTTIEQNKLEELIDNVEKQVYKAPVNATLGTYGEIIEEQIGYRLDRQMFQEHFYDYFYSNEQRVVDVPLLKQFPKVDTDLLQSIRAEQVGAYATYFNTGNKQRVNNIELASAAINNRVIFPGERFSFNEVVGMRTAERGYMAAPIIVRGELSEGIGGGICQVSSTLFNAIDKAALTINERYTHSKRVTYVPPGRDATVSWYGPDFVFTNNHNQPILIIAKAYTGTLVVKVFSSEKIDYEPRKVPSAPNRLPKEVRGSN
ncbi:VanW family protein [Shouchella patagoniensis]|uniref:VanW family protein n=1 Tax=Shouchella patagoniensis TaxID=228576 RepID=UPI001FE567E5|nr:VanW family protein [Shouchella patagoniensis]